MRKMASTATGTDFDVTTVLSLPMSQHYTTLTKGLTIPIVCGDEGRAFEFLVVALTASDGEPVAAVDIKSVFHAEIELDMTYLDDDIKHMTDTLHISAERAHQSLVANGFDLLAAIKAEEAQLVIDAESQKRQVFAPSVHHIITVPVQCPQVYTCLSGVRNIGSTRGASTRS